MQFGPSLEQISQIQKSTENFDLEQATAGLEQQIKKSSAVLGETEGMGDNDFNSAGGAEFDKEMAVFANEE